MTELKSKEKCPVCDMDVTTDKLKADYKGHSYYFCSESDKKTFIGNPEKYIGKAAKAA
jgi:YHS domain-containing protein